MKACSKCKIEKDINCFSVQSSSKSGYRSQCKECINNNENHKKYSKIYHSIQKVKDRKKEYQQQENYKDKRKIYNKIYNKLAREKNQKRQNERSLKDVNFRLSHNLRTRISKAVKRGQKSGSAISDLGCSIEDFKKYLEAQFHVNPRTGENMTFENYGYYGWHIDHIIPLVSFDLTNREQFLKACHYTNLQPLWKNENMTKGSREIKNEIDKKIVGF
jgi:hypothetical protein